MSLNKALAIFLLLSIAVSGCVIFFSADASSFEIFLLADPALLAAACALVVAVWVLDSLKLKTLVKAAGDSLPFSLAIKLTWINYFGAALTPMQSGGGPFQMYLMYKHGISIGKTVAITLVRTFLSIVILGSAAPFAFIFRDALPEMSLGLKGYMAYIVVFVAAAAFAFIASIVRPSIIKRVFALIIKGLSKIGIVKRSRVFGITRRVAREIDAYRDNIRDFLTTGRPWFLLSILLAWLQMMAYLSVMPIMIMSIDPSFGPERFMTCVIFQAIFILSLFFMPTPGGSGAAEGGAMLVASAFVDMKLAGMVGVGWRILTEYTGIALGAFVAFRFIGWTIANKIGSMSDDEVGRVVDGERGDKSGD